MTITPEILKKFFLIFDKKISINEEKKFFEWKKNQNEEKKPYFDKNFFNEKNKFFHQKNTWKFEEFDVKKFFSNWLQKNFYSQKFLKKFFKYQKIFAFCPFVKWIFIWNTIAFWSANEKSDIDLFIVFDNWKIWTGRFFLTILLHIFWLRRHWKKIAWRFCLSFFTSEKGSFNLEKIQISEKDFSENEKKIFEKVKKYKNFDIYLAIWTATLIPVFWEKKFFKDFFEQNKWIKDFWIKHIYTGFPPSQDWQNKIKIIFETILNFNFIENFLRKIWKKRAEKKKKNIKNNFWIIISDDFLKFHNEDLRVKILDELF